MQGTLNEQEIVLIMGYSRRPQARYRLERQGISTFLLWLLWRKIGVKSGWARKKNICTYRNFSSGVGRSVVVFLNTDDLVKLEVTHVSFLFGNNQWSPRRSSMRRLNPGDSPWSLLPPWGVNISRPTWKQSTYSTSEHNSYFVEVAWSILRKVNGIFRM